MPLLRARGSRSYGLPGDKTAVCRLNGGYDHEPSYCHCGMWLHPRRVFDVDAEPRFLPVGAADRGAADRIRAAGRGCPHRRGSILPHTLRADGARRPARSRSRSRCKATTRRPSMFAPKRPPTASYAEAAPPTRMQPNPVYAELTPAAPPRQKKKAPAQEEGRGQEVSGPAGGSSRRPPAPRRQRRRTRPARYPVELSLAAAPAGAIAPRSIATVGSAVRGSVAAAMDALADIRQSP